MINKKKANTIILDIYREVYAELGLDFDSCTEKSEEGWFNHFYMSNERQDEIINKHLKRKSKFVKDYVSINVWLGCSPCGRDFYYKLTKKDDNSFIKESKRVKWVDSGLNQFILPSLGRSLLMSPFDDNFTWFTTPIVEIIENEDWNRIEFKTENSHYYLDRILE